MIFSRAPYCRDIRFHWRLIQLLIGIAVGKALSVIFSRAIYCRDIRFHWRLIQLLIGIAVGGCRRQSSLYVIMSARHIRFHWRLYSCWLLC